MKPWVITYYDYKYRMLATLPMDVLYEIALFAIPHRYVLRDGVPEKKLDKNKLSTHPRALHYLITHPDIARGKSKYQTIKWWLPDTICINQSDDAVSFILSSSYTDSALLYRNPHPQIVRLLVPKLHTTPSHWIYACTNPNDDVVDLILEQLRYHWKPTEVEWWKTWRRLAENTNERIVDLFLSHGDDLKSFFPSLFSHPSERLTSYLLTHYEDCIIWSSLSSNKSNTAAMYLLTHPRETWWTIVSSNPNEILLDYLFQNKHLISYANMSQNPNPRAFMWLYEEHRNEINWTNVSYSNNPALFVPLPKETRELVKAWVHTLLYKK